MPDQASSHHSPFSCRYTRDVCFYFVAALLVFLIFCNGHIHAWEALGLVAYYCVFVIYVVRALAPVSPEGS